MKYYIIDLKMSIQPKNSEVVETICRYFHTITDERIDNLIQNSSEQVKKYQFSVNRDNREYLDSIVVIFNICHQMKSSFILPPLFHSCICEAYDKYTFAKYKSAKMHGFTILN
jgi:hypothetical protein